MMSLSMKRMVELWGKIIKLLDEITNFWEKLYLYWEINLGPEERM